MQDIYKAEKIGRNWCVTKNGDLLRVIGAYRGSEDSAMIQSVELNIAFALGYKEGLKFLREK